MRRSLLPASLLALLLLPGCGRHASESETTLPERAPAQAAPPPLASTAAEEPEQPATLEEAEAALARAQTELEAALGPIAFATPPPAAADQASGAAPAPAPKAGAPAQERAAPSKAQRPEGEASRAESASKKEASDCALACRAFQSLNRAVDAVCRLDTGGERCSRARRVAADAQAKVASCSCPAP